MEFAKSASALKNIIEKYYAARATSKKKVSSLSKLHFLGSLPKFACTSFLYLTVVLKYTLIKYPFS